MTAPGADRVCLFVDIGLQHDGAVVCGNHFGDEPQKFALQELSVADGVDDINDSEQGLQVTSHSTDLVLKCRELDWLLDSRGGGRGIGRSLGGADFGGGNFDLVCEKDQFGAADFYGVAVVNVPAADRDAIDEGPVVAVEVYELEQEAGLVDDAVFRRDCGIAQAKLTGFFAANGELAVNDCLNGACQ